jgi:hypothetical protein
MVQFAQKPPHSLSFRSAALSREECAALLPAASRFLADRVGFGMTIPGEVQRNYSDFRFTLTTVILEKPSSNVGAFSLALMRRITSSATTRSLL